MVLNITESTPNNPPTNLQINGNQLEIAENSVIGTVVGSFHATDPDVNASLTFHLISGNGAGG